MRKTNKSYTLSLCVDYALITTDSDSAKAIDLAHDDIYATQWMHEQGYKACIEGNTLVISKDFGWTKAESRYVIIPNIDYHDYRENRNYTAGIAVAKRFAMAHTLTIIRKINSGR
jgi:hypothetical protein